MNSMARPASAGFFAPAVSSRTLFCTIWSLTGLSFVILPARLYARWTTTKRLYWDDFFVVLASIISLAITIIITVYYPVTLEIMLIGAGLRSFPPNVATITMQFTRVFTAIPMLFYGGLWSIKLAFLLFFRRLGLRNVTSLRRWWRVVLGISVIAFLVCYATLPYHCTFVSFKVVASDECQKQGLSFVSMGVNTALDIVTDCLIMSIPILILRRVRISTKQRIALSAVFSLVIITMIFAIVRATITTVGVKRQIDPLWMYLWTSVELNVAIIVACIAPYRSLFIRSRNSSEQARRPHSIRQRAREFCADSLSRSSRRTTVEENWSSTELPYLAPWEGEAHDQHLQPASNLKYQVHGTTSISTQRTDPSMTAHMPYLAPWSDDETTAVSRGSHDVLLSPPPLAHVPVRAIGDSYASRAI